MVASVTLSIALIAIPVVVTVCASLVVCRGVLWSFSFYAHICFVVKRCLACFELFQDSVGTHIVYPRAACLELVYCGLYLSIRRPVCAGLHDMPARAGAD